MKNAEGLIDASAFLQNSKIQQLLVFVSACL